MWFNPKLFGSDTHPDGIYVKLYHENRSNLARLYCICIRWGGVGLGNAPVTWLRENVMGFCSSEKCSEGVVSSFSCGFIKSYLALIPIRTAFIWSYSIKIVQILHAYCMYRAGKVCGGGVGLGNAPLTWLRENVMGFCSVEIVQKGLFHRFHVVLLKVIWLWYPSGRHLYEAIA